MFCGIEVVDVIDEQVLFGELFQVDDQRIRSAVDVPLEVEEQATQGVHKLAGEAGRQPRGKLRTCVVHQASQPPHELQWTSVEPRMVAIWAFLVVPTGNSVEELAMDLYAITLLVMLTQTKRIQDLARLDVAAGVQRVPTVLLRSANHLPTDDRTDSILLAFALEHRARFSNANLLRRGSLADAGFLVDGERLDRQTLPLLHAARIAACPQRDIQVLGRRGLVHQRTHVRIALAGPAVEQGVQRGGFGRSAAPDG
jgi:hypothetical protein